LIRIQIIAAEEKKTFRCSISGKLEGIGARLQKNDLTEISELMVVQPGGKKS
jgi:carboxyl-terminal processing protease